MSPAGAIILLYHRVTSPVRDPQLLCVSPANFAAQLEVLGRFRQVIPLSRIAQELRRGRVTQGMAAITFDDGYADNLHEAAPILRRLDMPATVFATTAHADDGREFFWDDLERIFLSPGELPQGGRLASEGGEFQIDLGSASSYSQADAERHGNWTVLDPFDPTPRHRAYRDLCQVLHRCPIASRRQLLGQLQHWSGASNRTSSRIMTLSELKRLSAEGLIEIGGHTVDHPLLSVETPDIQRRQIIQNTEVLETAVGRPLAGFSYPFGTRHDFTSETVSIVKEAGYAFACANITDSVTESADPFRLPRLIVRDWTAEEFEQRLIAAGQSAGR